MIPTSTPTVKLAIAFGLTIITIIAFIINNKINGITQHEMITEITSDSYLTSSYNLVSIILYLHMFLNFTYIYF